MTPLNWDASRTVAENAREKLPELASQFFSAGAIAADEKTALADIHHFRLVTKRFRYTLELFAGDYYGPGLTHRIESLKSLQQLLGSISDCSATQKLLAGRKDLSVAELSRLHRKLDALARTRVANFRRFWLKNFTPTHQRSWTTYLSR